MEPQDENALHGINDLDAARLAVRGALATIRDLQDANAALKGQIQEETAKRKQLEHRLSRLGERLDSWQEKAREWESEREKALENWKAAALAEARAENQSRLDAGRRQTEETIARLFAADADRRALSDALAAREREAAALRASLAERDRLAENERARAFEEARLAAVQELSRLLDETERFRSQAFGERLSELEKRFEARTRARQEIMDGRARNLDDRERRLDEESARLAEKRRELDSRS